LDSCNDGTTGSYHVDESVDNINVSVIGGGNFQPGASVKVTAKVWAYSPTADFIDFYYANDATNPQWQFIETVHPSSSGENDVSTQYTLGNGNFQAVRVVIRYNGAASPCPGGTYDDSDDLAFVVSGSSPTGPVSTTPKPTPKPTPLPTLKPTVPPTQPPTTAKPTSCDASGAACDSTKSTNNCCNGCQTKGRWANTCK
jgi:hypothetical protein